MSETMTVTFHCAPGTATPERALDCQQRVIDLLQAIADDIRPGSVSFKLKQLTWVDDGKDEITVQVNAGVTQ